MSGAPEPKSVARQLHELREALTAIAVALTPGHEQEGYVDIPALHAIRDTPEPCKHCDEPIYKPTRQANFVHAAGPQTGKITCALDPYGFHAEPYGSQCFDHPANPCNGAHGITPRPE